MDKSEESNRYIVPAVEQAVNILKFMAESPNGIQSLSEIITQVKINKSKAFSILKTLQKHDLVEKRGQRGGYSLGSALVHLSRSYLDNLDITAQAMPILKQLADAFNCTAALGIAKEDYSYIAAKADPSLEYILVTLNVGQRFPIDMGSHGVAIASVLSDEKLELMLSKTYPTFHGKAGRFAPDEFRRQLTFCRKNGYSFEFGHVMPKLNGVCSPIVDSMRNAFAYIIVFGLFEESVVEDIGHMTVEGARKLSKQLG